MSKPDISKIQLRWDDEEQQLAYVDGGTIHGCPDCIQDEELGKRIVAAFNACQGVPTEKLKGMGKPEYLSCYDCGAEGYYIKVHGVVNAVTEGKVKPRQILEKGEAEGSVKPMRQEDPK